MKIDIDRIIKPELKTVQPYKLHKRTAAIKLDQNENPYGFPDDLKEEFWQRIREKNWARYTGYDAAELRQVLADHHAVGIDQILVANGSNSLIQSMLMVILAAGDSIVIPQPTFSLYGLTSQILSGRVIEVELERETFALSVERTLAAARAAEAKVIVLCSPNNPTGVAYDQQQILTIAENFSGIVIIDEAYAEFTDQDLRPFLQTHENLVLLRTLSKAFAMAGCRVGYLIAHPDFVREVSKSYLPYCVNIFAEVAAIVALKNVEALQGRIADIIAQRDRLFETLSQFTGMRVYPSQANFLLARFPRGAAEVFNTLLDRGILARDVSRYPMLENCLRFAVGTEQENLALTNELQSLQ